MKYASQKVAYVYFTGAMVLFLVQIVFGLLAGAVYVSPICWPRCCPSTSCG